MGYDFKSLTRQADEADYRKKFYTDFEDVDPTTLHQITELTEWLRTKAKGSDVREIIAQLFERTWLEGTKEGNANLEVAQARGGSPTLSDKLHQMEQADQSNKQKIDIASSQINGLIANAGNGTVPSELTDMRIDSKGVVHATAGEAVRNAVEKVYEVIGKDNPNDAVAHWWYHKIPNVFINPDDRDKLIVEFPEGNNGFTIYSKHGSKDVNLSSVFPVLSTSASGVVATFNNDTRKFELSKGKLVINLLTGTMNLRPFNVPSTNTELTLIANNLRNGAFGALIDDFLTKRQILKVVTQNTSDTVANWWYHNIPSIYISTSDVNKLVVEFPESNNGFTVFSKYGAKDIYLRTVFPVLSNPVEGVTSTFNERTRVFELSRGKLVLNLITGAITLRPFNVASNSEEITLLANNLRNGFFGALIDDVLNQKQIFRDLTSAQSDIPTYWIEHIDTKVREIQSALNTASLNSFAFLWITDTHWENNDRNSPVLIKRVMKQANIPFIVHGGDAFNGGKSDTMLKLAASSFEALRPEGKLLPVVMGNHDSNLYGDRQFTYKEMLDMVSKVENSTESFKFVDYPSSLAWSINYTRSDGASPKVYGFAFDTGTTSTVSRNQIQAFIDLCKNDGHVIGFMHWALDNQRWSATSSAIGTLADAINQKAPNVTVGTYGEFDLTGVNAHVVCFMSGHEHQDNHRLTTGGTPHIITTCDAGAKKANNDTFEYRTKTTTEQAFDVFVIDFDAKIIKDIRIGRGENREFTFS